MQVQQGLRVSFPELVGPVAVSELKQRGRQHRRRRRLSAPAIISAIADDAARAVGGQATIVTVPPADDGDSTVLFLRDGSRTQLVVAVSPELIRSPRLRGETTRRDLEAEGLYEMLRTVNAEQADTEPDADDAELLSA